MIYRYKLPGESFHDMKNYYNLGNFFIKSNLDPEPYAPGAYLRYSYAVSPESRGFEQMSFFSTSPNSSCHAKENTIKKINSEWGGYKHRPDRKCNLSNIIMTTKNHHKYSDKISNQCDIDVSTIEVQCIQAYMANQSFDKFAPLINRIKALC